MAFSLNQVVPWGRNFEEYVRMFDLTDKDLKRTILGCADGPASFNAELTRIGGRIISLDPIYQFTAREISKRVEMTAPEVMREVEANLDSFYWTGFKTPDDLLDARLTAMSIFCEDFENGIEQGRYVSGSMPHAPFKNRTFDLALCSHFLFLYSDHFSRDFHTDSVRELLRMAHEVRIFPVVELNNSPSRYLKPILDTFNSEIHSAELVTVPYEFQRGGHQMLQIKRRSA